MINQRMIVLTILVNGQPAGMIDLHNLVKNKKGEIGYWLSSNFQGNGIVTRSVTELCQYAFHELNLQYVDLIAAVQNGSSSRVAEHADFKLMGVRPKLIHGSDDGQIFRKINQTGEQKNEDMHDYRRRLSICYRWSFKLGATGNS